MWTFQTNNRTTVLDWQVCNRADVSLIVSFTKGSTTEDLAHFVSSYPP